MRFRCPTLALWVVLCLGAGSTPSVAFKNLLAADVLEMIEDGDEMFLLDVREYEEFCTDPMHIKNAVNLPWGTGILQARVAEIPSDIDVIVYCASGNRSSLASGWLDTQGYTNIHNLSGGMSQWLWDTESCDSESRLLLSRGPGGALVDWTPTPGEQDYDLLRGQLGDLTDAVTHVDLGPGECLQDDALFTYRDDPDPVLPGSTVFYLARQKSQTWGQSSAGLDRIPGSAECN